MAALSWTTFVWRAQTAQLTRQTTDLVSNLAFENFTLFYISVRCDSLGMINGLVKIYKKTGKSTESEKSEIAVLIKCPDHCEIQKRGVIEWKLTVNVHAGAIMGHASVVVICIVCLVRVPIHRLLLHVHASVELTRLRLVKKQTRFLVQRDFWFFCHVDESGLVWL